MICDGVKEDSIRAILELQDGGGGRKTGQNKTQTDPGADRENEMVLCEMDRTSVEDRTVWDFVITQLRGKQTFSVTETGWTHDRTVPLAYCKRRHGHMSSNRQPIHQKNDK